MAATRANSSATTQRLYINIDHVATIRQARRTDEPDPVEAARICEGAGADGITAHLREDRRHIQDDDIERLSGAVTTVLNLEMGCTDEMVAIALRLKPFQVTLVPERREEVTTEGGLDVVRESKRLDPALTKMRAAGIRTSLFIGPDDAAVGRSRELGVDAIELHTGAYSHAPKSPDTLDALRRASALGAPLGRFQLEAAIHAARAAVVRVSVFMFPPGRENLIGTDV